VGVVLEVEARVEEGSGYFGKHPSRRVWSAEKGAHAEGLRMFGGRRRFLFGVRTVPAAEPDARFVAGRLVVVPVMMVVVVILLAARGWGGGAGFVLFAWRGILARVHQATHCESDAP